MAIEFLANEDGFTILICRKPNSRSISSRTVLPSLQRVELDNLGLAYGLSDFCKARLAIGLNSCRDMFDLSGALDSRSADTAVARWISDIEKSIGRVAAAPSVDPDKFREANKAMASAADSWAAEQSDVDLHNLGFARQRFEDFVDHGTHHVITRWFETASLIMQFAADGKKLLQKRNIRSGFKDIFYDAIGRETVLYGNRLPRLYERVTGKTFGISKTKDEVTETTGVRFVIRAASSIGLTVTAANVAKHYYTAKRAGRGRLLAAEKKTRQ